MYVCYDQTINKKKREEIRCVKLMLRVILVFIMTLIEKQHQVHTY